MTSEKRHSKNIIFFYHKNHNDKFNGTSVYDKALLEILSEDFNIKTIEPENTSPRVGRINGVNAHYFLNLVKNVYLRQFQWLLGILRGKHLTSPENTFLLVEDVYSGPIPFLVSKLKGYKLIFRAADFGETYSKSLLIDHPIDRILYSRFRSFVESLLIKRANLIICPSLMVENAIRKKFPNLKCRYALLPYTRRIVSENETFEVKKVSVQTKSRRPVVLFLGDCRYPPNFEAVRFILSDLVPKLNGYNNNFDLLIAGANSDALLVSDFSNVKVLGPVDDTDKLFSEAHIGIAPIRTAGGLSMKIVDYLTHGLRVVATPEAASGIVENEQIILSEISGFAEAVKSEIIREINNGHETPKICELVVETYMSDKWAKDLRKIVSEIEPPRHH